MEDLLYTNNDVTENKISSYLFHVSE